MKREYWFAIIALVVGLVIGYGVWGTKAAQVANLTTQVQQLTQENTDLKAKLAAVPAPAPASAPAAAPSGTSEQKAQ